MINFRSVYKNYDSKKSSSAQEGQKAYAVDDLSLEIPSDKITVLVGPSGCGKSTTLRMINRMVEVTSGEVSIDGKNIEDYKPNELRRSIGYVLQGGGLLPNKTVQQNIATVPLLKKENKSHAMEKALELMDTVGLSRDFAKRYPDQLSGGQQQRVGVARALAADSPILLMDEPFSAVDPVVRHELQQELLSIQKKLAKTIVFVTHDIDEAILLGDKVVVLSKGAHIEQSAPPEELLRAPANDFVAEFIGHDRGVRYLSFVSGANLTVHQVPTISQENWNKISSNTHEKIENYLNDNNHVNDPLNLGWVLIIDGQKPQGWVDIRKHPYETAPGGSLFPRNGTLRQALDAALSSPSGYGVVVDESGNYFGAVDLDEVTERDEITKQA